MDRITEKIQRIRDVLSVLGPKVVACSGGLDSLLLAHVCSIEFADSTLIVHADGPAVPREAKRRFRTYAQLEKWNCQIIQTSEHLDEKYQKNPYDRCFICKSHLYAALALFRFDPGAKNFYRAEFSGQDEASRCVVLSGANRDDLKEYRPGLTAAKDYGVQHPFITAGIGKQDIRAIGRHLGLEYSEIAASPCLSSRVYTGTPIDPHALFLIDGLEEAIKEILNISVVRCRLNGKKISVEVMQGDLEKVTPQALEKLTREFLPHPSPFDSIALDPEPYKPGRAFVNHEY